LATNANAGNSAFFEVNIKIIAAADRANKKTHTWVVRDEHNFSKTFVFLKER
jgi:hypothetical protein